MLYDLTVRPRLISLATYILLRFNTKYMHLWNILIL